jgi:hypothetical protein
MNLHQIKIDFSAEEDRLLLAISTAPAGDQSGQEMLLWLTRRGVKLLWPALIKLAGSAPDIAVQNHPEARKAMLDMRHQAAVQKADFSKPYEQAERERPLGERPLLVTRMQYRALESGKYLLALLPQTGQGVNLTMDEKLLHSFCRLLQGAVAKAQWDIRLDLPRSADLPDAPVSLN